MHSLIRGSVFFNHTENHSSKGYLHETTETGTVISCGFMGSFGSCRAKRRRCCIFRRQSVQRPCQPQNFDHDTLKQAVAYCHARGVKVHLAVNTILLNHEIAPALDFVAFACTLPVDAVIVQDTGLLHLFAPSCAHTANSCFHTNVRAYSGRRKTSGGTRRLTGCTGSRIIFKRNQKKFPGH